MRLSASDLALVRDTKAHYTDLYMSIFQPNIVLQAQVNDSDIAKGERSITYDSVSAGAWQNVKTGSTLLVGSNAGERNVGKVRIKSITSSVITVAENTHIEWANDLYLTVLDYFDVWPIYPRIIQNPSNPETTLWYKDYDIVYTNQNTNLGCFMNIGPHRAVFVENGSAPLYFSASGSYPLSGSISQVYWTFQSGTPATYTGMTPGDVTWGTPGHYLVQCTISGSAWNETGYRYVSVYDLPSAGTNTPVQKWEISNLNGSRGEAGYTASITVYEPVTVEEGSVVVLFADEWYDGTRRSLGGNAPNAGKIKFVGYILDNSIEYDYANSAVSFEIGSLSQVMKEMEGFAVGVNSAASPTDWYELYDLNAKKAVYHYWKWHSNILSLTDVEPILQDFPVQYFDSDRESLWDAPDNFLRSAYHASAVCDRQGKIYLETDKWVVPNATGTAPIFTLLKSDWIGSPNITERRYPELSYLEYNGIAYSGVSTGTYAPLISEAPGSAPAYRGASEKRSGFAVGGQPQLNQITGDEFYHRNYPYPNIDTAMRGNWSNLDIAPQEAVQINVAASDTVRNKAISGLYMPVGLSFDFRDKSFLPRVTWNAITSGEPGETITIPEIPDDGGYGNPRTRVGGFTIPQVPIPSIPITTSNYSALKLQTDGTSTTSILPGVIREVPLTWIVFSTDDSSWAGATTSGTYSGVIYPTAGASGTYSINYGFVVSLPGIYRVTYSIEISQLFPPAITTPQAFKAWISATSVGSTNKFLEQNAKQYPDGITDSDNDVLTIEHSEIFKMPANGTVTIYVQNQGTSSGFVMYNGTATVEFLKYEP